MTNRWTYTYNNERLHSSLNYYTQAAYQMLMTKKDMAINIVNIPNEETIVAMRESEDMLKNDDAIKFDFVDSLFAELKSGNIA